MDDEALSRTSRDGQLSLSLEEMKTIQAHFRDLGREPTDCELETIAQTWSEHCSHKTLKGRIAFEGQIIDNLSGRDIADTIPMRKIAQALAFKLSSQPGFRWISRFKKLGKRLLVK